LATSAADDHVEVRLLDSDDLDDNPNLAFTLDDTAAVIAELRAEGHRVLVHCVRAEQRTPSVAVAYAVRQGATPEDARASIAEALPNSRQHGRLWDLADGFNR
jgi:ADP-ribosyl-[dinitrogen reductase] hydrolase